MCIYIMYIYICHIYIYIAIRVDVSRLMNGIFENKTNLLTLFKIHLLSTLGYIDV